MLVLDVLDGTVNERDFARFQDIDVANWIKRRG